jgi:hemoglobin
MRRLILSLLIAALAACSHTPAVPLYRQLGGPEGIHDIVQRTLTRVAQHPSAGRTFKGVKMPFLIDSVSQYVCKVADGPCVYEGETMARAHADLGLRGSEFDIMVTVLREELDRAGVSDAAKNELLRRLAPSRRDMVQR